MKTTNKLAVLAMCLIAAAALVTTSCNFGKDDFYGTWDSEYTYPGNTTDEDKAAQGSGYNSKFAGDKYTVSMYFSGKSENIIDKSALFYQHLTHYDSTKTTKKSETFWYGTYKLSENENYTCGKLHLSYIYGFTMAIDAKTQKATYTKDSKSYTVDDLIALALGEDPSTALAAIAGTTQLAKDSKDEDQCTDVEVFQFNLGGQDFFKGYTTMSAEEYLTYNAATETYKDVKKLVDANTDEAKDAHTGCSWGVKSRDFTLTEDNGDAAAAVEELTGDGTQANIIPPSTSLIVPEK